MININKCLVCKDRDINPNIGLGNGKYSEFCSRICYNLYHRIDLQFSSMDTLKILADRIHAYYMNEVNRADHV